jgi:hypothetical protein
MSSVPLPSRAESLGLFFASGIWTALVAFQIVGVVWLVAGPVLTAWAWLLWAMVQQRRRVRP